MLTLGLETRGFVNSTHVCLACTSTALCSSKKQLQEEDQPSFSSSGILRQEWSAGRGCVTSFLNGRGERRLGGRKKTVMQNIGV